MRICGALKFFREDIIMKIFRRFLAMLLSVVLLTTGLSAVGAAEGSTYGVDGFLNGEGLYCIRLSGLTFAELDEVTSAPIMLQQSGVEAWTNFFIELKNSGDSNVKLKLGAMLAPEGFFYVGAVDQESFQSYDIGARLYFNDENDAGVVFFMYESDAHVVQQYDHAKIIIDTCVVNGEDVQEINYLTAETTPDWGNVEETAPTEEETEEPVKTKDISELEISKTASKAYTGKALTPDVKILDGDYRLVKGTDYELSYENNKNIGTAKITVTGKGDYSGTITQSFTIKPKAVSKLKVKTKTASSVTLSWAKASNVTGYQVQIYKDGKWKTLKTISKNTTVTYKAAKLKSKTSYKFRVRAYKTVDGKKVYSSYKSVSAKTK